MKVLIFGTSLADGLTVGADGAGVCKVVSRWGETTVGLLHTSPTLRDELQKESFDIVILMAGTNDLANDVLPHYAIDNLMRMHRQCKSAGVPLSIGCTLVHDTFNRAYKERCKMARITLCEFLNERLDPSCLEDDGVHLNAIGKQD